MKELWGWLVLAVAAIAGIFGASWAKRKIEAHGAEKQRRAQILEAVRTEAKITEADANIDERTEAKIRKIQTAQAERHRKQAEREGRLPTAAEVDDFMKGPKG